ncbi:MAG: hypothetical protein BGN89_20705 [Alphaproteobacteria bacterium 64-6]|nr:MAG: hypothetical protein BGN89_20705 [Alphaproteobacteria bacterium 64-6]
MTDPTLTTTWNLGTDGDDLYARLMAAHEGLSDDESARLNVRLVLLLVNHIGDRVVLEEAIAAARRCGPEPTNAT